jgi:hypothetical protein
MLLMPCGLDAPTWATVQAEAAPGQDRGDQRTCPPADDSHHVGLLRTTAIMPGLKPTFFHALPDRIHFAVACHERDLPQPSACRATSHTLLSQHVLLRI